MLWDTAGVEEKLYGRGELNYLLEGNLLDGTDLTKTITNEVSTFRKRPSEADRMCALLRLAVSCLHSQNSARP